jgi:hypothetical protein
MNIDMEFWLDDKLFASRSSSFIPSVGDEVRFKLIVYKVTHRLWLYDTKRPLIVIIMVPI